MKCSYDKEPYGINNANEFAEAPFIACRDLSSSSSPTCQRFRASWGPNGTLDNWAFENLYNDIFRIQVVRSARLIYGFCIF